MKIDFVAPPFSGHLYPALQLARGIQKHSDHSIRVLSTASAKKAVEDSELAFIEILPGRDQDVWAIANTPEKVGSNPIRMWKQVRSNLALMCEMQRQVKRIWEETPPDVAIVDFVVPVAGLTAVEMGIHWWTGMPSPCALETTRGTPAYVGGWQPRQGIYGTLRDWTGRKVVRTFKQSTKFLFNRQLRELGIRSLYRADGTEVIYSSERILGYGLKELEFERNWPECFEFIGPLPLPPPHSPLELPTFRTGRKTVLVSLGTHLNWARQDIEQKIRAVARLMPTIDFHFSSGGSATHEVNQAENFTKYKFIPYTEVIQQYDAVIHHAGTGIMYACIKAGLPSLVAPQDYDQFDHAARLTHRGLAKQLPSNPEQIAKALEALFDDEEVRNNGIEFRQIAKSYDPVSKTLEFLSGIEA